MKSLEEQISDAALIIKLADPEPELISLEKELAENKAEVKEWSAVIGSEERKEAIGDRDIHLDRVKSLEEQIKRKLGPCYQQCRRMSCFSRQSSADDA